MRTRISLLTAVLSFFLLSVPLVLRAQNTVQTIAGGGPNNLPALQSGLGQPTAIVQDGAGNFYLWDWDSERVLKLDTNGRVSVVAGSGLWGYAGDGGPAINARFQAAWGSIAADQAGNIFIADTYNHVIREVDSTGTVRTIAGDGNCGYLGDGGPARSAEFCEPMSVAVDASDNVFVADADNYAVREISDATGNVTTVAGGNGSGYSGDGAPATSAQLAFPTGLFVDGAGNIYIADSDNYVVRKVSASTGNISTVAGNGTYGFSGNGGPAISAKIGVPWSVCVDASGNLFILDPSDSLIWEVSASTSNISIVSGSYALGPGYSGDGGSATSAQLSRPRGFFVDGSGNIFIADTYNSVIREVSGGNISTFAGVSIADPSGNGQLVGLEALGGDGYPAADVWWTYWNWPNQFATDSAGNIYIADQSMSVIRKISAVTGNITTVAGNGIYGSIGDGGPATAAELNFPQTVAIDAAGNIFIADMANCAIREVSAANGNITTVAGTIGSCGFAGDGQAATLAQLNNPTGIAVDSAGNLFIADMNNNVVREVTAQDGLISTIAGNPQQSGYSGDGGPATQAQFSAPFSIVLDGAGNLYIADAWNSAVREVTVADGNIQTVAGDGNWGYSGDGGPATSAQLGSMYVGLYLDPAGNLFIPDPDNYVVREVTAADGNINTVAGNGNLGFSGDGGPALAAEFSTPGAVAADASGNLLVMDNLRIRSVAGLVQSSSPPQASVSSPALGFQAEPLGSAAAAQSVTVTNTGTSSVSISTLAISGTNQADFRETDNCTGKTLIAGASCQANVTFTASVVGNEFAILTVTDSAGVQNVMLFASGIDFSASPATGGSTSATVSQGQTATYSLQLSATGGPQPFDRVARPRGAAGYVASVSVTVTCSGAPTGATCTLPSQPMVVSVGTPVSLNVSVRTTAPSRANAGTRAGPIKPGNVAGLLLFSMFAVGLVLMRPQRLRMMGLACALAMAIASAGCGSSRSTTVSPPPTGGTPVGAYTLTLTATAGNDSHTTQLPLTVTK